MHGKKKKFMMLSKEPKKNYVNPGRKYKRASQVPDNKRYEVSPLPMFCNGKGEFGRKRWILCSKIHLELRKRLAKCFVWVWPHTERRLGL